jgi:hypothetical protein
MYNAVPLLHWYNLIVLVCGPASELYCCCFLHICIADAAAAAASGEPETVLLVMLGGITFSEVGCVLVPHCMKVRFACRSCFAKELWLCLCCPCYSPCTAAQ